MEEKLYRYQLIRYVPDVRRMEPQNVGVVVQDETGTTSRLWSRFRPLGEKPDFDFANFRQWRQFFEEEVNGPQIPLFQPPRNRPEFLEYLQARCRGNYLVSRPLELVVETQDLSEVREYLYETLVRRPQEERETAEQPVRRFREALEERKIDRHPAFHVDEYVEVPGREPVLFHWLYNRNHGSEEKVLIDGVKWLGRIHDTQIELEHAIVAVRTVREAKLRSVFVVIVIDEPPAPSSEARNATKRLYENILKGKEEISRLADEVVNTPAAAEVCVDRIHQELFA